MARPAPAAERVLGVLDLLVTHPTERFTLSDLVRLTGMSLGSAHAVLAVLEDSGYVTRQKSPKVYSLGPALVVAGVVALEHHPAISAGRELLPKLAEELDVEAVLTARTRNDIIFVAREGRHSDRHPEVREGERVPLVPPFGTAFLAWSTDEDVEQWIARASKPTNELIQRVNRAMESVRRHGVVVTIDNDTQRTLGHQLYSLADDPSKHEIREDLGRLRSILESIDYFLVNFESNDAVDVGLIAAPIFDAQSKVVAALTVYGFDRTMTASEVRDVANRVRQVGLQATRASRGRIPS